MKKIKTMLTTPLGWICLLLLAPLQAAAQQDAGAGEARTATLDTVRVTAPSDDAASPAVTQELAGAAFVAQRSSTLGESLNALPGVSSTYFGPNASRPVVRAQEGARAVILQNGVSSLDVSGLSQDHAVPLEPLVMDRVQILRGPAALLYGHASALGMVNVQDSRIAREALFDAQGGKTGALNMGLGGAATTREVSGVLESGTDRYTLHVDGFERMTADTRTRDAVCEDAATGVLRSSPKICNSASQSWGGAVGATAHFE